MSPEMDQIPSKINPFDAVPKTTSISAQGFDERRAAEDSGAKQEFAERAAKAEQEVSPKTPVDVAALSARLDDALARQSFQDQRISDLESQLNDATEKNTAMDHFPGGQECQSLDKQFWVLVGDLLRVYETRKSRTPDHCRTILRYAIGRLQAELDVVPAS